MTMKRASLGLALGLFATSFGVADAQIAKMWDSMTNPKTSIQIEHPPSLPLRVKRVAFGETKGGACADSLQSRVLDDFFANSVEVVDRSQLDAVIAEHRLQGSALFDQKNASEVGRLLGAEALIFVEVLACNSTPSKKPVQYIVNKQLVNGYKFVLTGVLRGQLRTIDLTTGKLLAMKRFEARQAQEADGGYPPADSVMQAAELDAAGQIRRMFFPWQEPMELIFYDDKDCGLKTAHSLLKALDFDGALAQSEQNLENCRSQGTVKPKLLAHAAYNVGMMHFIRASYDKAVEYLTEAAKLNSSDVITEALAKCRTAKRTADEMARYEVDQATFLAESSGEAPPPAEHARTTAKAAGLAPSPAKPAGGNSLEERLRKLDSLRDKGLITKEEYAQKRAALLAEL